MYVYMYIYIYIYIYVHGPVAPPAEAPVGCALGRRRRPADEPNKLMNMNTYLITCNNG